MRKYKGFIAPQITKEHYIFGGGNVPLKTLQEDSDWTSLLPSEEQQNIRGIETFNCSAFGTTNAIELLMYKLTGERINYSDRWVGVIAGTKEPGNDPHVVAEAIRKYGLIPEEMLPFSDDIKTVDDYYSFKGADKEACYKAGREWLAKWDFKHEWTFTPGQPILEQMNNMKLALKGSPQCVAVYAWVSNDKGVYYSLGEPNHWTTVYNIDQYLKIFDSYSPIKKDVDQSILYCKRYSITKKNELTAEQVSGFQKILNWIAEQLGIIQKKINNLPKVDNSIEPKPQEVYNEVKETLMEKYDWSTQEKARHSVRVICDEEGLTVTEKNELCATVGGESAWLPRATGKPNKDGTRDYGIVQLNSKYWIGEGKLYPNIEAVYNDPEGCVRWMCKQWKAGNKNWWYAFKNGSYKKYLNPKFDSNGKLI